MEPKYSILYFKENIDNHYKDIGKFLQRGVKVFWFRIANDREVLRTDFEPFAKAFFLQAFSLEEIEGNNQFDHQIIIDGEGITKEAVKKSLFGWMEENILAFNTAQFKVECDAANCQRG